MNFRANKHKNENKKYNDNLGVTSALLRNKKINNLSYSVDYV